MRANRACLGVVLLLSCSGQPGRTNCVPGSGDGEPAAGADIWSVATGQAAYVCVPARRTMNLPAGSQAPPADSAGSCRTWPDRDLALPYVREKNWCGPCGFFFDRATTDRERTKRLDACCYQVGSPPPPPPPPPQAAQPPRLLAPARLADRVLLGPDQARALGLGPTGNGFEPYDTDVNRAEYQLSDCIANMPVQPPHEATTGAEIAARLSEYRAQYVGFIDDRGHRALWINLFRDPSGDRFPDWRTSVPVVRGGGTDFLRVVFDLEENRCIDVRVNSPR